MEKNELQRAWKEAYSLESMEGHGAEGRSLEYIGSRIGTHGRVYDFFADSNGCYWYSVRIGNVDKELIPEEEAIFGHAIRQRYRKHA